MRRRTSIGLSAAAVSALAVVVPVSAAHADGEAVYCHWNGSGWEATTNPGPGDVPMPSNDDQYLGCDSLGTPSTPDPEPAPQPDPPSDPAPAPDPAPQPDPQPAPDPQPQPQPPVVSQPDPAPQPPSNPAPAPAPGPSHTGGHKPAPAPAPAPSAGGKHSGGVVHHSHAPKAPTGHQATRGQHAAHHQAHHAPAPVTDYADAPIELTVPLHPIATIVTPHSSTPVTAFGPVIKSDRITGVGVLAPATPAPMAVKAQAGKHRKAVHVEVGRYGAHDYRIVWGDTLSQLSIRFHTTVDAIQHANPREIKDVDLIYAGDTIHIPTHRANR